MRITLRSTESKASAAAAAADVWTASPTHWRSFSLPLMFFVAAALCVPTIDAPLARLRPFTLLPDSIEAFFGRIETFGHSVGAVFAVLAVWSLDRAHRRMIPRLMAATWGAGLAANLVKMSVGRVRPFAWVDQAGNTLPQQFAGWFPLGTNGSLEQSFPSAHTATVVGLALGLTALYPQGKWLFGAIASLVAVQRILYGAHYASDVLFAAGLGWLVVAGLFHLRSVNRRFERFEQPQSVESKAIVRRAA